MTDRDWDDSTDPVAMIAFVAAHERKAWACRKLRLFAAATCRLVWDQLWDWRSREAVEGLERWADGPVRLRRLDALRQAADDVWSQPAKEWLYGDRGPYWQAFRAARPELSLESVAVARAIALATDPTDPTRGAVEVVGALSEFVESPTLCDLVREVCGNPLRRPRDRRWWSSDVRGVARTIEADRAFNRMPILGDALMDAGCDSDDVIRHCQSAGRHAVGCWVLDMALGRV